MSEEEIRNRIEVCKKCEINYREVDNNKRADKFHEEILKWEQLLDELNPKIYKELSDYKKGYYNLQQKNDKAIEYIEDYKDQWCGNDEVISDMNELLSILKGKNNENN